MTKVMKDKALKLAAKYRKRRIGKEVSVFNYFGFRVKFRAKPSLASG
jgi:hypothetical protein